MPGNAEGNPEGWLYSISGVPYAQPPVGELRFRPPRKAQSWDGVRDAVAFPNRCWQAEHEEGSFYEIEFYHDPAYLTPRSEDCLYLNIWMPGKKEEKLWE